MPLINGKIPAYTECPYKTRCSYNTGRLANTKCYHKGKEHPSEFSCALARLIHAIERK